MKESNAIGLFSCSLSHFTPLPSEYAFLGTASVANSSALRIYSGSDSKANSTSILDEYSDYLFIVSIPFPNMSQYTYQPLAYDDSIRILILEPGERQELIQCSLVPVRLSENPEYDAISYVWGTDEPSQEIFIDGQKVMIRTNLHSALLRFRRSPERNDSQEASNCNLQRRLWVDALCINQADIPERNQQVQSMKLVFAQARSVLIWLRESVESDRFAFDVFKIAQGIVQSRIWISEDEFKRFSKVAPSHRFQRNTWTAVNGVFKCTWFERIWVLQELVVAHDPLVICGEYETTWAALPATAYAVLMNTITDSEGKAVGMSGYKANLKARCPILGNMQIARACHFKNKQPTLCELLCVTHQLASSEPVDKIYALRGLLNEEEASSLKVDYALEASEVFELATRDVLSRDTDPFKLLLLLSSFPSAPISTSSPSWVPNYSSLTTAYVRTFFFAGAYRASGQARSQISFTGLNQKILCLDGHIVDKVSHCLSWKYLKQPNVEESARWYQKCQQYVLQTDCYPTGEDMFSCWWRLLVCDLSYDIYGEMRATEGFNTHYLDRKLSDFITNPTRLEGDDTIRDAQDAYRETAFSTSAGTSLCRTANGYLAWIPPHARSGDSVCIFAGATCPFVVRERPEGDYTLVGSTYVHGMMDGEALDFEGFKWGKIRIH